MEMVPPGNPESSSTGQVGGALDLLLPVFMEALLDSSKSELDILFIYPWGSAAPVPTPQRFKDGNLVLDHKVNTHVPCGV